MTLGVLKKRAEYGWTAPQAGLSTKQATVIEPRDTFRWGSAKLRLSACSLPDLNLLEGRRRLSRPSSDFVAGIWGTQDTWGRMLSYRD